MAVMEERAGTVTRITVAIAGGANAGGLAVTALHKAPAHTNSGSLHKMVPLQGVEPWFTALGLIRLNKAIKGSKFCLTATNPES